MGKEIIEKLCKEYTDIFTEKPGVLAVTESADLAQSAYNLAGVKKITHPDPTPRFFHDW